MISSAERAVPRTLSEAAAGLRDGRWSSVELTDRCLRRIADGDERLGSFLHVAAESALARAEEADREIGRGDRRGPLHGIPLAVKDNLHTIDMPTTAQSRVLIEDAPARRHDAEAVALLRSRGAVLIGKTTMIEFARGEVEIDGPFPVPRNPWDRDRWAGGSSSGMASSVVVGMCFGGLGTDTGGSIRLPAAYCGCSGLLPSAGRVPNGGVIPLAASLDRVGPIARTARDCGLLLAAVEAPSTAIDDDRELLRQMLSVPPSADGLRGLRIGVDWDRCAQQDGVPDHVAARYHEMADVLRDLGAVIVEVGLPWMDELNIASEIIISAEAMVLHRRTMQSRWSEYGHGTRRTIALGATYSAADLVVAWDRVAEARSCVDRMFQEIDLLLTPSTAGTAPLLVGSTPTQAPALGRSRYLRMWNLLGQPALSIPMGPAPDGLPLSAQLIGGRGRDALVLRGGEAYQEATAWHLSGPDQP